MSRFDIADSQLFDLCVDGRRQTLRLGFSYVGAYEEGSADQSGLADVAIAADQLEFVTVFQLMRSESVDHAYFRRAESLVGLDDLLLSPGLPVDDAEVVLSPFAEVAFRARSVTATHGPIVTEGYDRARRPHPTLSQSSTSDVLLPGPANGVSDLVTLSLMLYPGQEEVRFVFTEPARRNQPPSPRYVEICGVGLDLFTAHRVGPPFQITRLFIDREGRPVDLATIGADGLASPNVYLELGARSIIEWRPHRMSIRSIPELPQTTP